eukprot:GFKZ01014007.1.p1 GENE.GFKZ01014007.1~~GFKZ01014007.1.p1  ORF type:complete len:139 (-),score=14.94 GFKZ01014007.1:114-530(-)
MRRERREEGGHGFLQGWCLGMMIDSLQGHGLKAVEGRGNWAWWKSTNFRKLGELSWTKRLTHHHINCPGRTVGNGLLGEAATLLYSSCARLMLCDEVKPWMAVMQGVLQIQMCAVWRVGGPRFIVPAALHGCLEASLI